MEKGIYQEVYQFSNHMLGTKHFLNHSALCKNIQYFSVDETSNLMFEEAFFLSYVVGCLQVKFHDIFLNLDEIWKLFQKSTNNFVARYSISP